MGYNTPKQTVSQFQLKGRYSPLKFTVHWFDDTKTEVEMDSNIEDYRNTASYYDGHTMRDGSQRKRHVR